MHRFYCPDLEAGALDEEESRHATQVLRLKEGASASVFNGKGREASVRFTHVQPRQVKFETVSVVQTPPIASRISLGQALPKGKSMDLIIQKATELGIQTIYPILSERSVVHLKGERIERKQEKWRRIAVEACKQCGQNWLPEIHAPRSPADFFQQTAGDSSLKLIASLQPGAIPIHTFFSDNKKGREILFLIGPEGDFTPSEIAQARSEGFQPVSLGPTILRSETAAIFVASVLIYETQRNVF